MSSTWLDWTFDKNPGSPGLVNKGLFAILLILTLCHDAGALTINQRAGKLDVNFAHSGMTLPAHERLKIIAMLDRIRREDWCPFTLAVVVGHADASEGDEKAVVALTVKRAVYVATLLRRYGVPDQVVFAEGKGAKQPISATNRDSNARVELEFAGYPNHLTRECDAPLGQGGFRLEKRHF